MCASTVLCDQKVQKCDEEPETVALEIEIAIEMHRISVGLCDNRAERQKFPLPLIVTLE